MTEKTCFKLELAFSRTGSRITVNDPSSVDERLVMQAWNMMNELLMEELDSKGLEDITDEDFRELFIELCYKLIYREITALHLLPARERAFFDRLARGKRIQKLPERKGDL